MRGNQRVAGAVFQLVTRHPIRHQRRHLSKIGLVAEAMRPSFEAIAARSLLRLMPRLNQSVNQKLPFQQGNYVPREEDQEIKDCFRELSKRNPSNQVNVIVLHGPGGYGKSCTAGDFVSKLYISRLSSTYFRLQKKTNPKWRFLEAPIVKWTLDASSEKSLLESYCDLAKVLDLQKDAKKAKHHISLSSRTSTGRQHHNEVSHHVQVKDSAMKKALESIYQAVMEKLDEFPGFVLIVDGVKQESANLAEYWPTEGEQRKGKGLVVITTQDPNYLIKGNKHEECLRKVSVWKMKSEDGMKLLEESSGVKTTEPAEEQCARTIVVEELDCNPQDIAAFGRQLSALVKKKGDKYKFSTLKKLLKERKSDETEPTSGLPVLLHMMRGNTPEVFKLLACCSGEHPVPLRIIEDFVPDKDNLLNKLQKSEFLEVRQSHWSELISLHQRQHMGLRTILNQRTEKQFNKKNPFLETLSVFLGMKPDEISAPRLTHEDISKAIQCMSKACKGSMQYKSDQEYAMIKWAHPHLKELLQVAKDLGLKDKIPGKNIATAHACLGESYLFSGSSRNAAKHLAKARCEYKHHSDKDCRLEEATVLHFLGEAFGYRHLGDPLRGEHHLRNALKMKEDIFGKEDNPEIALTLTSLANVLNEQGRHTEAIKCLERALKVFKPSEEDANYLQEKGFVLSGLGSSYRFLGLFREAEEQLKRALEIFESLEHPSDLRVGVTLSRLASVQRELEQIPESIASLEKAREKFGKNKEYQAAIYSKLSVVYRYKEEDEQSLEYAKKAKLIIEENIKKNKIHGHPGFATACLNLGHALSDLGETSDALEYLQRALRTYETLHGDHHRTTATTLNYIGSTLLRMGKATEAKKKLERARKIMEDNYDLSHLGRANTLKRLSKVCRILGELPRSGALAQEALKICEKAFHKSFILDHRELRKCKTLAAKAYSDLGLYEKARACMAVVCAHFEGNGEGDSVENARIQRISAEVLLDYLDVSEFEDKVARHAERFLDRAESLSTRRLQTGLILRERARLLLLMGDTDKAHCQVVKSLKIVQEACEGQQDHYVVADAAVLKSDIERKLDLHDESRKTIQNALKAYKKEFVGDNHPKVAKTLLRLCRTSLETGNSEEAARYYHESKKMCDVIREDLAMQIEENEFEGLEGYDVDKQFPLFKFQNSIRKQLNMPKERTKKPGEWACI